MISIPRAAIFIALATLACCAAVGVVLYRSTSAEFEAQARDKYEALMQVRRSALTEYLESVREETRFWNKNRVMRSALVEFTAAWNKLASPSAELQKLYIHDSIYPLGEKDNLEDPGDGSEYSQVHARYHYWLRSFLLHRGVYDVFLFDPQGNLVYTSFKELDYATNLLTGEYRETDLGNAFRAARDNPFPSYVSFFDFAPYGPSHGAPASFFSSAILDDAGAFLGVVAFQIPVERIDEIMQVQVGMGSSGETYAVGPDLLMRSNSRFSERSTILETTVDTETTKLALAGETGFQITPDYRGIPVYSAYGPLDFEGVRWAVLAEIDVAEVGEPLAELRALLLVALPVIALGATGLALLAAYLFRDRSPSKIKL